MLPVVVESDESYFFRRKYNGRSWIPDLWVFGGPTLGGIERGTMVELGVVVWNDCAAISVTAAISAAKTASKLYAKTVPL